MLPVAAASGPIVDKDSLQGVLDVNLMVGIMAMAMVLYCCVKQGLIRPVHVSSTPVGVSCVRFLLACVWGAFALFSALLSCRHFGVVLS
jgi:hypothetical protein